MFTRRAKPIRIIGDPDNERPDKEFYCTFMFHQSKESKTAIRKQQASEYERKYDECTVAGKQHDSHVIVLFLV